MPKKADLDYEHPVQVQEGVKENCYSALLVLNDPHEEEGMQLIEFTVCGIRKRVPIQNIKAIGMDEPRPSRQRRPVIADEEEIASLNNELSNDMQSEGKKKEAQRKEAQPDWLKPRTRIESVSREATWRNKGIRLRRSVLALF